MKQTERHSANKQETKWFRINSFKRYSLAQLPSVVSQLTYSCCFLSASSQFRRWLLWLLPRTVDFCSWPRWPVQRSEDPSPRGSVLHLRVSPRWIFGRSLVSCLQRNSYESFQLRRERFQWWWQCSSTLVPKTKQTNCQTFLSYQQINKSLKLNYLNHKYLIFIRTDQPVFEFTTKRLKRRNIFWNFNVFRNRADETNILGYEKVVVNKYLPVYWLAIVPFFRYRHNCQGVSREQGTKHVSKGSIGGSHNTPSRKNSNI